MRDAAEEAFNSGWEVEDGDIEEASPSSTACSSLGEVTYPALPLLLLPSSSCTPALEEACWSGILVAAAMEELAFRFVWLISCMLSTDMDASQYITFTQAFRRLTSSPGDSVITLLLALRSSILNNAL